MLVFYYKAKDSVVPSTEISQIPWNECTGGLDYLDTAFAKSGVK